MKIKLYRNHQGPRFMTGTLPFVGKKGHQRLIWIGPLFILVQP